MSDIDTNQELCIVPSILAADFANLASSIKLVSAADWLHVDVMDGRFVPNITIGPPVVAALSKVTQQFLDVHLMIVEPEKFVEVFAAAGAGGLTVHAEACPNLHRVLQQIKACNLRAGVALNPATPPDVLDWVWELVDLVLVMTVNPGFGGQQFIPDMLRKVALIQAMRQKRQSQCIIEVDGGVDVYTAPSLVQAGARALVAGTAVFGASQPDMALAELTRIVRLASTSQ